MAKGAKKTSRGSTISPDDLRLGLIRQITENQKVAHDKASEAQSYAPLRQLLIDPRLGIEIPQQDIVIDAAVPSGRERPDIQIWLEGVTPELRNENEHLYAIIEVKSGTKVRDGGKALAKGEIAAYRYERLSTFWLADAEVVHRYDLGSPGTPIPSPLEWTWTDLADGGHLADCFSPIIGDRRSLRASLDRFSKITVPIGKAVGAVNRREFIESIVTVARILSRSISNLVNTTLVADLQAANAALEAVEAQYGAATFNWSNPDEYVVFADEPERTDVEAQHQFNAAYTELLSELAPRRYALVAEWQHLPAFARRSGFKPTEVSILKNTKESKAAREAFIQETAALLFSRLMMIRFSEDHELLSRYISNGGLAAFAEYATHFELPFQKLVSEAYENARSLYRHLFEPRALDWILARREPQLGDDILHAMWILARWDFSTVRGDILSGVYDRSLNDSQRKRLGEVYTRPELARYLLRACNWDGTQSLLDPACGSGTFLVEAFDAVLRRYEEAGVTFDADNAIDLLSRLFGLDINDFSATLAKIQVLWHVLSMAKGAPAEIMGRAITALRIEGGHDSLDPWGMKMAPTLELFGGQDGRANREREATRAVAPRTLKVGDRRFRDISSDHEAYDIVIGNPPYVRVQRFGMPPETEGAYAEIKRQQTDLSAFFVYRALRWWLKPGGRMAFFLPLALAEAAYADNLRRVIEGFKIIEILDLELVGNAAFHGANVVTIALVVEKTEPSPDDEVRIVTVPAEALDPDRNLIDMDKAEVSVLKRSEVLLARYLPEDDVAPLEDDQEATGSTDNDAQAPQSGLLTKLREADISILDRLAKCERLGSLVQVGFERQGAQPTRREVAIPSGDNPNQWVPKPVSGQGLEIGGTPPLDATGTRVLRARSVYPDGVEGEVYGRWRPGGTKITQARFYNWAGVVDVKRTYVARKIALQPTFSCHPPETYLTNTVYMFQLSSTFPLHIYSLSRIPAWFLSKTARMSVIQKFWSTWVPRNLLLMPVPSPIKKALEKELRTIGSRIYAAAGELARGAEDLRDYAGNPAQVRPLNSRLDLISSGILPKPDSVHWPDSEDDWSSAAAVISAGKVRFVTPTPLIPDLAARTPSGRPCEFEVGEPRLLRWLHWLATDLLHEGLLPSQKWLSKAPIPNDLDDAIRLLDRLADREAEKEFEAAMAELDALVADALGLPPPEAAYIIEQMKRDPLLREIRPAWRHLGKR